MAPTLLYKKLGLKAAQKVIFFHAPSSFWEKSLLIFPPDLEFHEEAQTGEMDYVHYFATDLAPLRKDLPALKSAIHKKGMVWISWLKKSSGIKTDLNGNIVRELGLTGGLVDVKVCSIDDQWSALKFVYRLKDR